MPVDKNGKEIRVGSRVRVIEIDSSLLETLPDDEVEAVGSMLNDVLEAYQIDEYDRAWVEKWWDRGNGRTESHSLSLSASEMELVDDVSAGS